MYAEAEVQSFKDMRCSTFKKNTNKHFTELTKLEKLNDREIGTTYYGVFRFNNIIFTLRRI